MQLSNRGDRGLAELVAVLIRYTFLIAEEMEIENRAIAHVEAAQLVPVFCSYVFERRPPHPGAGISECNHQLGAVVSTGCTFPEHCPLGVDDIGGNVVDRVAVEVA